MLRASVHSSVTMMRTPFFFAMVVTCLNAVELGAGAVATLYVMRLPKNGLLTAVEAPLLIMEVCMAATIALVVASTLEQVRNEPDTCYYACKGMHQANVANQHQWVDTGETWPQSARV